MKNAASAMEHQEFVSDAVSEMMAESDQATPWQEADGREPLGGGAEAQNK
jgi:hypothetical protein